MDDGGGEEGGSGLTPKLDPTIIPPLFRAEAQEKQLARKVTGLQILVTLAAAGAAYGWESSPQYAIAVLGGGGASVLNGTLLALGMSRASSRSSHLNAHQQLRLMYFYAAERFLAVVTTLGFCLAVFKLSPLAVMGGFALGQATLLLARLVLKIKFESGFKNVQ